MKKIHLALSILLMCCLSLSNAISAEIEITNKAPQSTPGIIPRSKQGSEAFQGTWFLFYTYPENTEIKQDKIVMDSLTELIVSGKTAAKGTYYADQAMEGKSIICLDFRPVTDTDPAIYTCATKTVDNDIISLEFTLVKSSESLAYLGNGKLGIGGNFDKSREDLESNSSRVTGYLESESTEAVYNETNNELDIPAVNYMGTQYRVIFQDDQGNFELTLRDALPLNSQLEVEAIYNEAEKELEIPAVIYQGSKYRVTLKEDDEVALKFELKEAVLIME